MKRFLTLKLTSEELHARIVSSYRPTPKPALEMDLVMELGDDPAPVPAPQDGEPERKRRRLSRDLDEGVKLMVMEKLMKRQAAPPGTLAPFALSLQEVMDFFAANFPDVAKHLNRSTLHAWRNDAEALPIFGPSPKRGRPFILPMEHRLAMGALLRDIAAGGAPMNSKIARPVLVGYLKERGAEDLYSKKPAEGKITFSRQWISELFTGFGLSVRKATTNQLALPEARPSPRRPNPSCSTPLGLGGAAPSSGLSHRAVDC